MQMIKLLVLLLLVGCQNRITVADCHRLYGLPYDGCRDHKNERTISLGDCHKVGREWRGMTDVKTDFDYCRTCQ